MNGRNDNRLEMLIPSFYFGCSKFILNLRATIIFPNRELARGIARNLIWGYNAIRGRYKFSKTLKILKNIKNFKVALFLEVHIYKYIPIYPRRYAPGACPVTDDEQQMVTSWRISRERNPLISIISQCQLDNFVFGLGTGFKVYTFYKMLFRGRNVKSN